MRNKECPKASLVIFGATGDLAKRKLYPSIFNLFQKGELSENFRILGVALDDLSKEAFQVRVKEALQSNKLDQNIEDFCNHIDYLSLDITKPEAYNRLQDHLLQTEKDYQIPSNRIFYMATAPRFFGEVATNLKKAGILNNDGCKRLVVEKPFGRDYESAKQLNNQLRTAFSEEDIYRIDHYLGKEMVLNIEYLRFANTFLEPLWNKTYISNIQITSTETLGVEDRGSYYEKAGALRDMVQNHLVQIATLLAMEPPAKLTAEEFRQEKINVLRSLKLLAPKQVDDFFVRGQYDQGTIQEEKQLPAYREEVHVDPNSKTETFVAGKLLFDNDRWAGVPFYIRTGKRMVEKSTKIVVELKKSPLNTHYQQLNTKEELGPNLFVIEIYPDFKVTLYVNGKELGLTDETETYPLQVIRDESLGAYAYERLIYDCIHGNSSHFAHWEEVALSWKFIDQIESHWNATSVNFPNYESGSMGPVEAHMLLEKDGHAWWPVENESNPENKQALKLAYSEKLPFSIKRKRNNLG